jgi:hypothetical protein
MTLATHIKWGRELAASFNATQAVSAGELNAMVGALCRAAIDFLDKHQQPEAQLCLYHGTTADTLASLLFDGCDRRKMFAVPFYLPENQQGLVDYDKGFLTFNSFLMANFMRLAFVFGERDRLIHGMRCLPAVVSLHFEEGTPTL